MNVTLRLGSKSEEVDLNDAQALIRHARTSTMADTYQQFVPESQWRTVGRMGSKLVNWELPGSATRFRKLGL
jgi:hypothetical protein